jgi:uncharacterized protein (TIGR03435 family)
MRSIPLPGANLRMIWRALIVVGFTALAIPVGLGQAGAPVPPPSADSPYVATMTFDVVSVRESKPDLDKGFTVGGGFTGDSSVLRMTNNSIRNMLTLAYGLSWYQLENLPDWTHHSIYNVQAKSDDATDAKLAILTKEQRRLEQQHMMQVLLADRFSLKTHWETREGPVYNLVVAKGGPKMQAGGSLPPSAEELKGFGDHKMPEIHQRGNGKRGYEFIGHACHMTSLAEILASLMSTDIIDKTGLAGTYDFDLQYSQAPEERREEDLTIWPPITEAVERQLGLKLEHAKGPVKRLVVDHIDQPSQN